MTQGAVINDTALTARPAPFRNGRSGRQLRLAAALGTGPALMWLSGWIHPHDSASGVVTFYAAHSHQQLWLYAHLLGILAAMLWAWGALALVGGTGPGARTLRIGARLLIVGALAEAFDQWGHGLTTYVATTTPNGAVFAPELIWRYEHAAPINVLMGLSAALFLALPVLAIGLYRSRTVPRPAAVLLAASLVPPMMINNSGWPLFVAAIPMMTSFATLAISLARDTQPPT